MYHIESITQEPQHCRDAECKIPKEQHYCCISEAVQARAVN